MDQAALEDAALIRRTLAGDRNAFEGVVRRHHTDLLRLLKGITRNLEDAEDLTQEAFLRAFQALDRFDTRRPFRPWLWTIGIRLAVQGKQRKGRTNLSLDAAAAGSQEDPIRDGRWTADPQALERIEGRLAQIDLMRRLETLDPDHRAILLLRAMENRTYAEIAEILEIPEGTVMSRLSRARATLRERLREEVPEEGL